MLLIKIEEVKLKISNRFHVEEKLKKKSINILKLKAAWKKVQLADVVNIFVEETFAAVDFI